MEQLVEGEFYHIYNRGNNGEILFYTEKNYRYFLEKYAFYLEEYLETYAYCLMPNHFHLLVRVKEKTDLPGFENLAGLAVSRQFSNFFNSYAKAINKQQNRHGSLFEKPFQRKRVDSEKYFHTLTYYIHQNPVHHGFEKNLFDWQWSSVHGILSDKPTKISREKVLDFFEGKENFLKFHQEIHSFDVLEKLVLE